MRKKWALWTKLYLAAAWDRAFSAPMIDVMQPARASWTRYCCAWPGACHGWCTATLHSDVGCPLSKLAIASRRRKFSRISAYYLARRFNLSSREFAMVLSSAAEYKAAEVADRNAIVALKLSKKELTTLAPITDKWEATRTFTSGDPLYSLCTSECVTLFANLNYLEACSSMKRLLPLFLLIASLLLLAQQQSDTSTDAGSSLRNFMALRTTIA